jgi:hypothetical protein
MHYRVVFDIAETGYKSWSFPAFGLIFIIAGVGLVLFRGHFPGWWGKRPGASSVFAFSFLGFALLWTAIAFFSTSNEYSSLSSSKAEGNVAIVEGPVTDFKPMPYSGHAIESFCVEGKCFSYSDYVVTSGFNNTSSHGGPIREGLQVRVSYVDNAIVKLEVAQ